MENRAALAETVRTSMERHHVPGVAVGPLIDGPYKGERAEFLRGPEGEIRWLRMGRIFAPQGPPTPRDEL